MKKYLALIFVCLSMLFGVYTLTYAFSGYVPSVNENVNGTFTVSPLVSGVAQYVNVYDSATSTVPLASYFVATGTPSYTFNQFAGYGQFGYSVVLTPQSTACVSNLSSCLSIALGLGISNVWQPLASWNENYTDAILVLGGVIVGILTLLAAMLGLHWGYCKFHTYITGKKF